MSLRVLVVDDSMVARNMVIRTMRMAGLPLRSVLEAKDGVEGLSVLRGHSVDLAILDLNMPRMGGMELLEQLRDDEDLKHVPVVVVSTEGSATRHEAIRRRRATFVRKPFAPEALVEAIVLAIGGTDEED